MKRRRSDVAGAELAFANRGRAVIQHGSRPQDVPPRDAAANEGYTVDANPRGFVFNADLVSVIRFLDIGTRAAQVVR